MHITNKINLIHNLIRCWCWCIVFSSAPITLLISCNLIAIWILSASVGCDFFQICCNNRSRFIIALPNDKFFVCNGSSNWSICFWRLLFTGSGVAVHWGTNSNGTGTDAFSCWWSKVSAEVAAALWLNALVITVAAKITLAKVLLVDLRLTDLRRNLPVLAAVPRCDINLAKIKCPHANRLKPLNTPGVGSWLVTVLLWGVFKKKTGEAYPGFKGSCLQ